MLELGPNVNADARRKALADSLINTHFWPAGYPILRQLAWEAAAYHCMRPYPYWQFSDWKTEDRGTLPRCLPLARRIVTKGARWLFGKPIELHMPGNTTAEEAIRKAWQYNRMTTRMVGGAEKGGYQGGLFLKYSYDETKPEPLRFDILSVIDECRLFYDPHDSDRLLMVRIQYKTFNPQDGEYYAYREEWTDDWEVHYRPQPVKEINAGRSGSPYAVCTVPVIAGSKTELDLYDRWEITSKTPNPFGVIPGHAIRNIDCLASFGVGDLWTDAAGGMFRVLDRINLAYHFMDKSNQMDSERNLVFVDLNVGPEVIGRPVPPGEAISAKSDVDPNSGEVRKGQVVQLEASGAMRPHMMEYADSLRKEILATVGSVDVNTEEVSNRGNLTQAVLTQLYHPLIEATEEKRKTYGEDGICKFLEKVVCGLANLGASKAVGRVDPQNHDTFNVNLRWPDYFPLGDDEKTSRFTRVSQEVEAGMLPQERAVEIVLQMEGVEDIPKAKEELKPAMDRAERMRDAAADQAEAQVEATKNPPVAQGSSKQAIGAGWRSKNSSK